MTEELASPFLFAFYESLPRQGPGNETITREILNELPEPKKRLRIIDMGSGTGAQTFVMAERGDVIAVDIHQPFLATLMENAKKRHLSNRITTIVSSMDSLPTELSQFDLIWSEGAIYIIGFERGLSIWKNFVRPGGFVVVSELTQLTDNPPTEVADYWYAEYPAVKTISENCLIIKKTGYKSLKTRILPASAWDDFYAPQIEKIKKLRAGPLKAEEEPMILDIEQEIEHQKNYPDCFGYVFYIMQRTA